ncbi:MAG TPA: kynureninase [Flavisolibacter sp.]|nr:kynureninase [Flavisolibacter sp.]
MQYENSIEFARQLDQQDPLKTFRQQFHIPQHGGRDTIYFTGNSLGLQPKTVKACVEQELEDWARLGVKGHFGARNPWFSYHEIFPRQLSAIVGALPEEIVVMNQLTVNLHLLLTSFYRPGKKRFKIICEAKAFPSDQYAMESQVRLHGLHPEEAIVELSPRQGEYHIRTEDIEAAIQREGEATALVLIGGVNYYSGQVFDLESITAAAHAVGAYAGFDLAHAAGNVNLSLHDWQVDFACWCSYKYLNSGPGGVAGAFIHQKHIRDTTLPRLAGWWGYEKESRFKMQPGFKPIPTAEGWQLSNAPVLSMAAHKASLDIFEEAGMQRLTEKSRLLSGFLMHLLEGANEGGQGSGVEIITPRTVESRGCQVSMLMHKDGRKVFEALIAKGVVADWREPNVIRVAPVPLYNTFEDVWRFGDYIRSMLSGRF